MVNGADHLSIDAARTSTPLTALIDQSKPVLDSQTETGLRSGRGRQPGEHHWPAAEPGHRGGRDTGQRPWCRRGGAGTLDRLRPTLPIVLANLVSIGEVAVTYQPNLEQLLVLLPQGTAITQGVGVAKRNTKQDYRGDYLVFNLNLSCLRCRRRCRCPAQLPPPCTTGFLPAQQQRVPTFDDYPNRPAGDLYCRVPQDAPFNVRGARNLPCETVPGKRAPTVKMCESNENYMPLNDGYNWKGDPNATLSGQPVPQLPPGSPPAQALRRRSGAATIAAAEYNPANGTYVGPDGRLHAVQSGPECPRGANMAGNADAPGEEVSESATQDKQPEPAEVDETEDETGNDGEAKGEEPADDEADADADEEAPAKPKMSARPAGDRRGAGDPVGAGGIDGVARVPRIRVAPGRPAAQAVPPGGQARRAEPHHHRLTARPTPIFSASWTGDRHLLRRLPAPGAAVHRVVKKAQSHSEGTITEAALESESGDQAQVLVAVTVKTSTAGAPKKGRVRGGCASRCRRWMTSPRCPTWSSCPK